MEFLYVYGPVRLGWGESINKTNKVVISFKEEQVFLSCLAAFWEWWVHYTCLLLETTLIQIIWKIWSFQGETKILKKKKVITVGFLLRGGGAWAKNKRVWDKPFRSWEKIPIVDWTTWRRKKLECNTVWLGVKSTVRMNFFPQEVPESEKLTLLKDIKPGIHCFDHVRFSSLWILEFQNYLRIYLMQTYVHFQLNFSILWVISI